MDQYVDSRQKEILWDLLANPANTGSAYIQSLERLAHDHPQSGILQVLLARAGDKPQLGRAAIYYNPRTLHKLINHPDHLVEVSPANIIAIPDLLFTDTNTEQGEVIVAGEQQASHEQDADHDGTAEEITTIPDETINEPAVAAYDTDESNEAAAEDTEIVIEEPAAETTETTPANGDAGLIDSSLQGSETPDADEVLAADEEQADNIAEPADQPEPVAEEPTLTTPAAEIERPVFGSRFPKRDIANNFTAEPDYPQQHDIEDEVYEEIVSIEDIGFEAIANEHTAPLEPEMEARFSDPYAVPDEEEASPVLFHQPQPVVEPVQSYNQHINDQEDRLILGGIVNTDYLSFDKKLDELRSATPAETAPDESAQPVAASHEVSRYDDDKMPYSFMWWLDKTRKEHAANLQPYAANTAVRSSTKEPAVAPKANTADELQQQYYENIFSLTSVSAVDRDAEPAGIAFDHTKKEDVIIERFIHTEPQIKPLSADKLDNENKAKKSSEDQNELVTETLARIYSDQMLYHKAIATYKKLVLKFPEKKLYFASQIEQLEKKTN